MKKKLIWIVVILVVLILALIGLKSGGVIGKDEGTKVATEKVTTRTIIETVNASGKVFPEIEVKVSPDISGEIVDLEVEERPEYLAGLGVTETGLGKLIRGAYHTLGMISFFTAGEKEARAWTIRKGAKAPEAAGEIHSDIERGFIRAQVIAYDQLIEAGSEVAAKEKGWMRLEGKEYVVQDGDVIEFRFNV